MIQRLRIKFLSKSHLRSLSTILFSTSCLVDQRGGCLEARNKVLNAYREGNHAMYVSIYNHANVVLDVSKDITSSWSDLWKEANTVFEEKFLMDDGLAHLSDKIIIGGRVRTSSLHDCSMSTNFMLTTSIGTSPFIASWLTLAILSYCFPTLRTISTGRC